MAITEARQDIFYKTESSWKWTAGIDPWRLNYFSFQVMRTVSEFHSKCKQVSTLTTIPISYHPEILHDIQVQKIKTALQASELRGRIRALQSEGLDRVLNLPPSRANMDKTAHVSKTSFSQKLKVIFTSQLAKRKLGISYMHSSCFVYCRVHYKNKALS